MIDIDRFNDGSKRIKNTKPTHQLIMIKRYEPINLTSLNATYLQ